MCTVAIGSVLYLIFPLAFLNEDLDLQGLLLLWLLAGIIAGLSLFFNNFQSAFEVFLQKIIFFWEKVHIRRFILKNTLIHSSANRKTALVYSVSLAILNFVYVSYYIELSSLSRKKYFQHGGELVLNRPNIFKLQKYFEKSKLISDIDFSWTIHPIESAQSTSFEMDLPGLENYSPPDYSIQNIEFAITDLSKQYQHEISPRLPSPNFIENIVDKEGYHPFASFGPQVKNMTWDLYLKENYRSVVISKSMYHNFYGDTWDTSKPVYLFIEIMDPQKKKHYYKVRVAGVIEYIPGGDFSVMPFSNKKEVFVSPDLFFEFNQITKKDLSDLEMEILILNPKKNANQTLKQEEFIIDRINGSAHAVEAESSPAQAEADEAEMTYDDIFKDLTTHSVFYNDQIFRLSDVVEEYANTEKMLNIIFNGTTLLVLIICFFNLTASMSSKITASRIQLGILRCLGLSKVRTALIFLYDSFLIVFCASVIGLIAGGFLASLLVMQRTLFLDIPMDFHVNGFNFIIIIVASFLSAFFSAFIPTINFLRKPLSQITK